MLGYYGHEFIRNGQVYSLFPFPTDSLHIPIPSVLPILTLSR